jgi:lysophospholipase L1-like esterase
MANFSPGTRRRLLLALLLVTGASFLGRAQPFLGEINAFKKLDSIHFPPKGVILFVGSSSFHFWTDVQAYFPGYTIINRGFGGSCLPDVIRYAQDIIFPYQPKQVVVYCGENDLASSDTVTAEIVYQRWVELFSLIRSQMPGENIVFISLKPSPSRIRLDEKMQQANQLIKNFMARQTNASFVDVYHPMLTPQGRPIPGIFMPDSLHMNPSGYQIWKKAIQPYLLN